MSLESTSVQEATSSCIPETFGFSSALPGADVIRSKFLFRPWLLGLLLTLAQLVVAVLLLAPEGPFSFRYESLVQYDGFWFGNIVDRGYQTIVPPINHKVMEVSNVAFFPAYPVLAGLLQSVLRIDTEAALPLAAQLAAWGFWSYFSANAGNSRPRCAFSALWRLSRIPPHSFSSPVTPNHFFSWHLSASSTGAAVMAAPRKFGPRSME